MAAANNDIAASGNGSFPNSNSTTATTPPTGLRADVQVHIHIYETPPKSRGRQTARKDRVHDVGHVVAHGHWDYGNPTGASEGVIVSPYSNSNTPSSEAFKRKLNTRLMNTPSSGGTPSWHTVDGPLTPIKAAAVRAVSAKDTYMTVPVSDDTSKVNEAATATPKPGKTLKRWMKNRKQSRSFSFTSPTPTPVTHRQPRLSQPGNGKPEGKVLDFSGMDHASSHLMDA